MARAWWWLVGGLAAAQAPYWALVVARVMHA